MDQLVTIIEFHFNIYLHMRYVPHKNWSMRLRIMERNIRLFNARELHERSPACGAIDTRTHYLRLRLMMEGLVTKYVIS